MGKKLYVGNLPYTTKDTDLKTKFEEFGAVTSSKIILDRDSGRSKGFGFIEMTNDEEALNAIEKLNGFEYGGRALTVSEAKPVVPNNNPRFNRG